MLEAPRKFHSFKTPVAAHHDILVTHLVHSRFVFLSFLIRDPNGETDSSINQPRGGLPT
jgi:hypothetical protein